VNARVTLPLLDARIDARAQATRAAHAWWPCAEGCDHCCRSLPRLPVITRAEWERLREALATLPADVQDGVRARTLEVREATPVICPMLDRSRGSCLVYGARPIACRTYGFYTERDAGLHCNKVSDAVDEHAGEGPVLWGNGEAIAADMKSFGEAASLVEWIHS
jgi:Fe-S-cluster containining protein